jgi:CO/xanthine dehydrogenase Mo-binding subunit
MKKYTRVGKAELKIDSLSLATGNHKFTDDFAVKDSLHLALLYSPHAHAEILDIDDSEARKSPGVVDVFHYKNVKPILHTTAGQGFPEPSPYDTVLFDKKVRFVGDKVAMVAAKSLKEAREALKKIRVEYKILDPLFDPEKAMEADAPKLHGPDHHAAIPVTYDPDKNLAAEVEIGFGDLKKGESEADFIVDETYHAHYASHCAIEPHSVKTFFDEMGRLVIISSTQVPFHARRIVSKVCEFPLAKIRVVKPRIGGGFGAKQEVMLEQLAAWVTIKLKQPATLILSREEVFRSSRTRHPVRTRLTMGVKKNGEITFLDMNTLLNSGAYGTHALTVLSNCGAKVLPLLNKIENLHFLGRSVYTNLPVGGAYRGYGATQGYFALNQHLDIISRKLHVDFIDFVKKHHIREGETSQVFKAIGEGTEGVTQTVKSCELDACLDWGARAIGWKDKRGKRITNGDKVRGIGAAVAMQGSGIPLIDMGAASMKINDDGSFNLDVGATDIGTGSDTILAQIAGEVLGVGPDKIIVLSSDTDRTPFDVGAYASSTTYISGGAVKKCAEKIREQIFDVAVTMKGWDRKDLVLAEESVKNRKTGETVSLSDIAVFALYTKDQFQIQASASHTAPESPPPFIAHFVELDVDKRTGKVDLIRVATAVDCGQAINPVLAEGQVEGAVVNGLSYAMAEKYVFTSKGNLINAHFKDYKIFTAADLPEMKTHIVESYEETGPFGAKSVAEIGINVSMPAIANAIYDAVGVRLFQAPFTPDKVYAALKKAGQL